MTSFDFIMTWNTCTCIANSYLYCTEAILIASTVAAVCDSALIYMAATKRANVYMLASPPTPVCMLTKTPCLNCIALFW